MTQRNYLKFTVIEGTKLGRACIATADIEEGEIICKMEGTPITFKQFCERYDPECDDQLQIDDDKYIDLMEPYICFNHSCDPNSGLRNNGVMFAIKKIKKNDEIFFDYSTTADDPSWHMQCKCGSKLCRGIISDFLSIPHERKQFYLEKGALMSHIIKKYY